MRRLEHCRQISSTEWVAKCPAHDDANPSLSIRDEGGGRTLIHCHAGCSGLDVLNAIGLDWSDLYPPTDKNYYAERVHREKTVDALVVEIAMADIRSGKKLSAEDRDRARAALFRLDRGIKSPEAGDIDVVAVAEKYSL